MIAGYQLIRGFLDGGEAARWCDAIAARDAAFHRVASKAGLNQPYRVLDGHRIADELPALSELAARLRDAAQRATGEALAPLHDTRRALRVQRYRGDEGFRWHLDGGKYSALLTLANDNRGATEVLSPAWSRALLPLPFVFPLQAAFRIGRPTALVSDPGDLLVLHGRRILHRGAVGRGAGERIVVVASFDPVGTRPSPRFDRFARWLNY